MHGRLESGKAVSSGATLYDVEELSPANTGRPPVVYPGLPEVEFHITAAWAPVRKALVRGHAVDSCLATRVMQLPARLGEAPCRRGRLCANIWAGGEVPLLPPEPYPLGEGQPARPSLVPLFRHDGTRRHILISHDATEQNAYDRGKKNRHMRKTSC